MDKKLISQKIIKLQDQVLMIKNLCLKETLIRLLKTLHNYDIMIDKFNTINYFYIYYLLKNILK